MQDSTGLILRVGDGDVWLIRADSDIIVSSQWLKSIIGEDTPIFGDVGLDPVKTPHTARVTIEYAEGAMVTYDITGRDDARDTYTLRRVD